MSRRTYAGPVSTAPTGRRHLEGWRIGTLLGVPVLLARSWFLIAAVITLLFAPTVQGIAPRLGAAAYLVAFGYAILLFASVVVHEVAHAAAARAFGMPAKHIVINLWGGHTQFETDATSPGRSFVVAVVGPLSNAALAVLALPLMLTTTRGSLGFLMLYAFVFTNGLVAVFNLVPGLPLDGGRMLEAGIWKVTGDRNTGTVVAAWGGRLIAVALVLVLVVRPLLVGERFSLFTLVWAVLIGGLLWTSAGHALRAARIRRRAPSVTVRALARPAVEQPASVSIAEAMASVGAEHPADLGNRPVLLLGPDGGLAGVLDAAAVSDVPAARRVDVPASAAGRALPAEAVVDARLGGEELLRVLGTLPGEEWAVRGEDGRWLGLLKGHDVVTAMVGERRATTRPTRS